MSITNLPDEVLLHIWKYLSVDDIFNMATISPNWKRISREEIPRSKFEFVTIDNLKMPLARIRLFIYFILKHSKSVENLLFFNFSRESHFKNISSCMKASGLNVTNVIIKVTKLDSRDFIQMPPYLYRYKTLRIRFSDDTDEKYLGRICHSGVFDRLITVLAGSGGVPVIYYISLLKGSPALTSPLAE